MVGDTLRDLQAAQAAGCEPHLVRSGRAARSATTQVRRMLSRRCRARMVHDDLAASPTSCCERERTIARFGRRRTPRADARLPAGALRSAAVPAVDAGHRGALGAWRWCCCRSSCAARRCTGCAWAGCAWRSGARASSAACATACTAWRTCPPRPDGHARGAAGVQAPVDLGDLRLPDADAAPAGLRVQARAAAASRSSAGRWAGWT